MDGFERLHEPGAAIEEAIEAPLIAYNIAAGGPHRYKPVALVLRDPATAAIAGGLWAECYYDWMFIKLLVVPEARRGQGLGRAMMREAEAIARADGLDGIWLDTFSFQARGFYEKLGYTCFGTLPGYPRHGARFFLQKRL